eukprot:403358278
MSRTKTHDSDLKRAQSTFQIPSQTNKDSLKPKDQINQGNDKNSPSKSNTQQSKSLLSIVSEKIRSKMKVIKALNKKNQNEDNVVVTEEIVYVIRKKPTQRIITDTKNMSHDWTKQEDQLLLDASRKYAGNWQKVAQEVQTKDSTECFKRAQKIINPQNSTQQQLAWNENIDKQILQGYHLYGTNWKLIAKHIPGKSAQQIKDRYNVALKNGPKVLITSRSVDSNQKATTIIESDDALHKFQRVNLTKNQMFSKQEDKKLLKLTTLYNQDWIKIATHFVKKSANQVKERFHELNSQLSKSQVTIQRNKSRTTIGSPQNVEQLLELKKQSVSQHISNDTTSINSKVMTDINMMDMHQTSNFLDTIMEDQGGNYDSNQTENRVQMSEAQGRKSDAQTQFLYQQQDPTTLLLQNHCYQQQAERISFKNHVNFNNQPSLNSNNGFINQYLHLNSLQQEQQFHSLNSNHSNDFNIKVQNSNLLNQRLSYKNQNSLGIESQNSFRKFGLKFSAKNSNYLVSQDSFKRSISRSSKKLILLQNDYNRRFSMTSSQLDRINTFNSNKSMKYQPPRENKHKNVDQISFLDTFLLQEQYEEDGIHIEDLF